MTESGDAGRWSALDLDTLHFDDDLDGFDLDSLPPPGGARVPLIVEVDPDLVANLERDARAQGVTVEDVVRQRLRGAA